MGIHTADAIVLRQYPYRETSVIVTCLTDRYGKLKGLVKGLRVQPNRHRSAMEPLTVNRLVFYDTRTSSLHLIAQCDLLSSLAQLTTDLETLQSAAFCAELADAVVPLDEPQPAAYHLLKDALERLALDGGDPAALRAHFTVRLLHLAGFQPQLDRCTGCQTTVHREGYWSASQGGLLCAGCLHEDPTAESMSPAFLEALEALTASPQPIPLAPQLLAVLHHRLEEFLHWRLEQPLKTLGARGSGLGASAPTAQSPQPPA